jgi:hypothetical protein
MIQVNFFTDLSRAEQFVGAGIRTETKVIERIVEHSGLLPYPQTKIRYSLPGVRSSRSPFHPNGIARILHRRPCGQVCRDCLRTPKSLSRNPRSDRRRLRGPRPAKTRLARIDPSLAMTAAGQRPPYAPQASRIRRVPRRQEPSPVRPSRELRAPVSAAISCTLTCTWSPVLHATLEDIANPERATSIRHQEPTEYRRRVPARPGGSRTRIS